MHLYIYRYFTSCTSQCGGASSLMFTVNQVQCRSFTLIGVSFLSCMVMFLPPSARCNTVFQPLGSLRLHFPREDVHTTLYQRDVTLALCPKLKKKHPNPTHELKQRLVCEVMTGEWSVGGCKATGVAQGSLIQTVCVQWSSWWLLFASLSELVQRKQVNISYFFYRLKLI